MNQSVRVQFDTLRSLAFGSIAAGYTVVGSVFAHPVRLLVIQNYTDGDLTFSFDGINDHLQLGQGSQIVLDFASDASSVAGMWSLSVGDGVYVKQSEVPTTGSVYVTGAYGRGE